MQNLISIRRTTLVFWSNTQFATVRFLCVSFLVPCHAHRLHQCTDFDDLYVIRNNKSEHQSEQKDFSRNLTTLISSSRLNESCPSELCKAATVLSAQTWFGWSVCVMAASGRRLFCRRSLRRRDDCWRRPSRYDAARSAHARLWPHRGRDRGPSQAARPVYCRRRGRARTRRWWRRRGWARGTHRTPFWRVRLRPDTRSRSTPRRCGSTPRSDPRQLAAPVDPTARTRATDKLAYTHNSSAVVQLLTSYAIIRLEARLQPNIGFTLRRVLAVFTRSSIPPPKVNRFR